MSLVLSSVFKIKIFGGIIFIWSKYFECGNVFYYEVVVFFLIRLAWCSWVCSCVLKIYEPSTSTVFKIKIFLASYLFEVSISSAEKIFNMKCVVFF